LPGVTEENHENLSQYSRFPDQDLKPGSTEYEAEVHISFKVTTKFISVLSEQFRLMIKLVSPVLAVLNQISNITLKTEAASTPEISVNFC
jgi:hypothetical protein